MDTKARHALKKDKFAQATASSMSWLSGHRSGVLRWVIVGVVVLVAGIASLVFLNFRSTTADAALDAAMDVYTAPLAQPGAPAEKGIYTTANDRSKAANQQFTAVASSMAGSRRAPRPTTLQGSRTRSWGRMAPPRRS